MRHVIVHYHTFKNSGTSFDELLQHNFGDAHVSFDGPFPFSQFNQDELNKVIQRHPQAVAISSHQIRLPVPTSLWMNSLAVVFVREPLLRVRSIYGFSRRNGTPPTALERREFDEAALTPLERWAADMDFNDWVLKLREDGRLHPLSNSQTQIFGGIYGGRRETRQVKRGTDSAYTIADLEQAKRNLMAVPLLARTEHYAEDVAKFPDILANYNIAFDVAELAAANVTNPDMHLPVEQRLERVRDELSASTYDWLVAANKQDSQLIRFAGELLAQRGQQG